VRTKRHGRDRSASDVARRRFATEAGDLPARRRLQKCREYGHRLGLDRDGGDTPCPDAGKKRRSAACRSWMRPGCVTAAIRCQRPAAAQDGTPAAVSGKDEMNTCDSAWVRRSRWHEHGRHAIAGNQPSSSGSGNRGQNNRSETAADRRRFRSGDIGRQIQAGSSNTLRLQTRIGWADVGRTHAPKTTYQEAADVHSCPGINSVTSSWDLAEFACRLSRLRQTLRHAIEGAVPVSTPRPPERQVPVAGLSCCATP
jgi:hypothetical protein